MTAAIHLTVSAPPRQDFRHQCPVTRCRVNLPGSKFICKLHWGSVPADLRRAWQEAALARNAAAMREIARQATLPRLALLAPRAQVSGRPPWMTEGVA